MLITDAQVHLWEPSRPDRPLARGCAGVRSAERQPCDTQADIAGLPHYCGEDHLMIGTDYTQADQSAEIEAHRVVMERGEKGEIPLPAAQKIVDDNGHGVYGL